MVGGGKANLDMEKKKLRAKETPRKRRTPTAGFVFHATFGKARCSKFNRRGEGPVSAKLKGVSGLSPAEKDGHQQRKVLGKRGMAAPKRSRETGGETSAFSEKKTVHRPGGHGEAGHELGDHHTREVDHGETGGLRMDVMRGIGREGDRKRRERRRDPKVQLQRSNDREQKKKKRC